MWFEELVGFNETSADEVRRRLRVDGEVMTSTANGRSMRCGTLTMPSLAELRELTPDPAPGSDALTMRQIVGDAGALHRDPNHAGALFQAASQFNLLEMVSPNVTPEAGVAGYEHDPTQGPACAVACGAGTILRNYFVEVNGQVGQTADHQLDCLADVADHLYPHGGPAWTMTNGYAMFSAKELQRLDSRLAEMSEHDLDQVRARLRIGVHRNVEVTTASGGQTVTQAYCSALPVAYNRRVDQAGFERFARLALEASYEATLRAAALNARRTGNRTVFLTMLGGGVFGNDQAWIIDAIDRACALLGDLPLDVAIVAYRSPAAAVTELIERR
ncbi:MAG: hypothetical protein KDB24_04030 [Microthrixaceae bacterium]|nr:hypothetical protein [Microthrixaceae bacterium]